MKKNRNSLIYILFLGLIILGIVYLVGNINPRSLVDKSTTTSNNTSITPNNLTKPSAKHVNRGEVIGIMGNTGSSTRTQLHFAVYNLSESDLDKFNFNSGYENPFNYLQNREVPFEANSCDDISIRIIKSIGSGSWDWPLSNPTILQCHGYTPLSSTNQVNNNGIDMWDDVNPLVKAAEAGNAYTYRGGQLAGNGVFIFHKNGKMTLYWHLQ